MPIHHPARLRPPAPTRVRCCAACRGRAPRRLPQQERLLTREWLVTNGLGGYASGTVSGVMTRRYHGLLVAALPAPVRPRGDAQPPRGAPAAAGRAEDRARRGGARRIEPGAARRAVPARVQARSAACRCGSSTWAGGRSRSACCCRISRTPCTSRTRCVAGRRAGAPGSPSRRCTSGTTKPRSACRSTSRMPSPSSRTSTRSPATACRRCGCWSAAKAARFTIQPHRVRQVLYRMEESRGYESAGDWWSPGHFRVWLGADAEATLVASTESWEAIRALTPERRAGGRTAAGASGCSRSRPSGARDGTAAELVLAADQFIIKPAGRLEDAARAHAAGDEVRTVIAGYHWFTDWGRDTMISLEGLTLATGRHVEAGYILRTFAHYVRDGLIPNMFPGRAEPGPLSHGRRDAVVLPRRGSLRRRHRRSRHTARAAPRLPRHRRPPRARHAVRHRRGSGRRAAAPGRGGLPAHVDGREGRRLGRHAAPRQGGRDQRALVQRAAAAGALAARGGRRGGRPADRGAGRSRRDVASTPASGTRRAATCTTSSTARPATTPPAGRTSCSRCRSTIRCSTSAAGRPSSRSSAIGC